MVLVIGVDTSCDDTSVAVVDVSSHQVLSNVRYTQAVHEIFGGVVPEFASRYHLEILPKLWAKALKEAGMDEKDMDYFAVTASPGLIGSLVVGLNFVKAMAAVYNKKFYIVDHLFAHAWIGTWTKSFTYPALFLVVSGGHTELYYMNKLGDFELLAKTRDDAAGELIDKVGREYGLGYPAGPEVDKIVMNRWQNGLSVKPYPLPKVDYSSFSFSGWKTRAIYNLKKFLSDTTGDVDIDEKRCEELHVLMDSVAEQLLSRVEYWLEKKNVECVVIGGGVAASSYIRKRFEEFGNRRCLKVSFTPRKFCPDNGAMVAAAVEYALTFGSRPWVDFGDYFSDAASHSVFLR